MLKQFMSSRLGRENSEDRSELIRKVNKLLSLNKVVPQPDKAPMQIDAWSLQGFIFPQNENQWQQKEHCKLFRAKTCIMSDNLIESLHPLKNENNRNRAEQLLASGSVLHPIVRHIMVKY